METRDLLIEIGTEELPPKSLKALMVSFADNLASELRAASFAFSGTEGYATPRRLAVIVRDLPASQRDQAVERRGPSVAAAFDDAGVPTKAATGFAKSCGVEVDDLERMETDKGAWLVFRQTKPGQAIGDLLGEIANRALAKLPVDRRMRWGASRTEFVRPVHWLVVLYGKDVVPLTLLGQDASRTSHGHRYMGERVDLECANDYVEALRSQFVLVDFDERMETIRTQVAEQAKSLGGEAVVDTALLEEVSALVEWPVTLAGKFDRQFLDLPEEALISVMTEHQRYFHLRNKKGGLLPAFLTVANLESRNPDAVISGNERVIKPRLSDAAFFYEMDIKTTLADKLPRLGDVLFQSELGSYLAKAERIEHLARTIAGSIGTNEDAAGRAGLLCKVDLVTDMVGEFPELQGIMGGYYAGEDEEPAEVALAIREHYLPSQSGGPLPSTHTGCCVALADKLDTLVGLFAIGQPPTGSSDPFALRRQALGIIRICIEKQLDIDFQEAIADAARIYESRFRVEPAALTTIVDYLLDRLGNWYQDQGIRGDTFNAVRQSHAGITNLREAHDRVLAMHAFRDHERVENLAAANKRVANILRDIERDSLPDIDDNRFEHDAERALVKDLSKARRKMEKAKDYERQFLALADLQPVIDRYFDDVLVMTDDPDLRNNRLATLQQMRDVFLSLADFSVLQPGPEGR